MDWKESQKEGGKSAKIQEILRLFEALQARENIGSIPERGLQERQPD